jgi:hypothetical protein
MRKKVTLISLCAVLAIALAGVYTKGLLDGRSGKNLLLVETAEAAKQQSTAPSAWSPTKPYPKHNVYYPGTEELKPDEMRVIALGTGMPMPRLKQAAACFLIELGNGDKSYGPHG